MDLKLEKVVTYFLFPGLLFPCVCYLLYLALSAPLGLVLLPGLALLACHHHYRGKHDDVLIEDPGRYNVIVVGAGVSGLIAGARLTQQGLPFTILEAATEVGGTWHYNTYPGCACDVWTSLYQITFCPNPNWSRFVAPAKEIKEYLITFAKKFDLYPNIQLETAVLSATWRPEEAQWRVVTTKGIYHARILISACGALHQPVLPQIRGVDTFRGPSFHSSQWDDSVDLAGKRVAVVGSAASAVQLVPQIADKVDQLFVFQRTPNWFFPKLDPVYSEGVKALFRRFPVLMTIQRLILFITVEAWSLVWLNKGKLSDLFGKFLLLQMKKQMEGFPPSLAEKFIPDYKVGCKRVLLTSDFIPVFRKKHCHLVTDPIEEVGIDGIKTTTENIKLDVIIYATGFSIEKSFCPFDTFGMKDKKLREELAANPSPYLGMTVPDFPNFFFLLGPNTVLAHSSVIWMMECQVEYILKTINVMSELHIRSLEPRMDRTRDFQQKMSEWTLSKNFSTNCKGWYKNKDGKNIVLWPASLLQYWRMTFQPDLLRDYKIDFFDEYYRK